MQILEGIAPWEDESIHEEGEQAILRFLRKYGETLIPKHKCTIARTSPKQSCCDISRLKSNFIENKPIESQKNIPQHKERGLKHPSVLQIVEGNECSKDHVRSLRQFTAQPPKPPSNIILEPQVIVRTRPCPPQKSIEDFGLLFTAKFRKNSKVKRRIICHRRTENIPSTPTPKSKTPNHSELRKIITAFQKENLLQVIKQKEDRLVSPDQLQPQGNVPLRLRLFPIYFKFYEDSRKQNQKFEKKIQTKAYKCHTGNLGNSGGPKLKMEELFQKRDFGDEHL